MHKGRVQDMYKVEVPMTYLETRLLRSGQVRLNPFNPLNPDFHPVLFED